MTAKLSAGKFVRNGKKMLGLAVLAGVALICAGSVRAQSKPAPSQVGRAIPPGAQSVLSATLGSADQSYRAKTSARGYATENPASHISAQYAANGVEIRLQRAKLGLEFEGWGYGEHVVGGATAPVAGRAKSNRVEYRRGSLTEWYVNGPLGIEQGFTISQRPATFANSRSEALDIALRLRGNLIPSVDSGRHALTLRNQNGVDVLRYGPLLAYDASGRELPSWLDEQGGHLRLRVNTEGARYPVVVDPFVQSAQLNVTGVNGAPTYFGTAIAVSDDGTVVVAGACGSDPTTGVCTLPTSVQPVGDTSTPFEGKAYVFVEPESGWGAITTTPTATLTAPDAAVGDGFGSAVAINAAGTIIVVSAPQHECQFVLENGADVGECQGEAYVFSVSAVTGWPSVGTPAILTANGGAIGDFFANSLAMDQAGDTIVAREFNPTTDEGHVNIYVRSGAAWSSTIETTQLQSSDITPFDNFGFGLGISGDGKTVVAGSFAANQFAGEAYVFVEPTAAGGWASVASPIPQSAILLNSDASEDGELGNAAAVDQAGDTVVIGALGQFQQGGEAYVYLKGGGWTGTLDETTRLAANDAVFSESFGNNVSISDDGSTIAVGSNAGGAYLFTEPSGGWPTGSPTPILDSTSNPIELLPTLTTGTNQFVLFNGIVSGNTIASGATGTVLVSVTANNSNAGTVFIYGTQSGPTETIAETSGSAQTATVTTQFTAPLMATVVNGSGTGVSGVTVTFAAPASGASGTFSGGVNTAVTDESGVATSGVFTANATAGSYTVTATAPNVTGIASFSLTNQAALIGTTITINSTASLYHSFPLPVNTALVDGPPVNVNFTVQQASGSVTPTGTVVVTDGFGDTCTTTTLNSGAGMCTFPTIPQFGTGTTTLTATYTPFVNSAFLAAPPSSPVTENLVEILSPCATAPTPPKGTPQQQESITTVCLGGNLSVVPNVAEVTNGVPHEACGASTSLLPAGAGEYMVTVTCTKNVPGATVSLPNAPPRRGPWMLTVFEFVALLSILTALQLARQRRTRLRLSCAAGLLCVLVLGGMSACNGPAGAPPGNYTVDFTVTAGQFQLVVPVTVTVPR
jgi:hypothetical protein